MSEKKTIVRYLAITSIVQGGLFLMLELALTRKLSVSQRTVRDLLLSNGVAVDVVDKINASFASISNEFVWIFLVAMAVTAMSFGWLVRSIRNKWPQ